MNTGIYTITNLFNNKMYVGSTGVNFKYRFNNHIKALKLNKHKNKHLQTSWNKYGENNFKFEILEECDIEFCLSIELYWITMLNTKNRNFGYNICDPLKTRLGINHTIETKNKLKITRNSNQYKIFYKPVLQYTIDDIFIKKWDSACVAGKSLNIKRSDISKCCTNRLKSISMFKWKLE